MQKPHLDGFPSNGVLADLAPATRDLFRGHLINVDLPVRTKLEQPNRKITHVYFITAGLVSVVTSVRHRRLEIAIFGREGMSGTALLMGACHSPHETYMQISGSALRIEVDDFLKTVESYPTLRESALRFARELNLQIAQTALATAHFSIEERLARWLLMASERIGSDQLPLTHEFLSLMLGVRRAGVTTALNMLKEQLAIATTRGFITITDREALAQLSNGAFTASSV